MLNFAPAVYIARYLHAIGKLDPATRKKALHYMQTGKTIKDFGHYSNQFKVSYCIRISERVDVSASGWIIQRIRRSRSLWKHVVF